MKLIHWIEFPQWTFTVYFLQVLEDGQDAPPCTVYQTSVECEKYLHTMNGSALELTHNHGSEADDDFKLWNGNTGADADGALKADEPKFRGFGHIAFNCDDVDAATELLLSKGVKFHKKPNEGRMKGLAFALDPDGYWIEIVRRQAGIFKSYYNFSQVMMRVKDGPATIKFYQEHFGCTVLREMKAETFTNFFLASVTPEELKAAMAKDPECKDQTELDPSKPNNLGKILWNQCLEFTWNHGTESNPEFKIHNGNDKPQGFGHIGFLMDDLDDSCAKMEANGAVFKKKPADGNMRNLAFVYDPDGYWIELIDRKASFAGICSNY